MNNINSWYEVSIELVNRKVHILSTESMEEAENKKKELSEVGIKVIIEEWKLTKEIPILMGEI